MIQYEVVGEIKAICINTLNVLWDFVYPLKFLAVIGDC